MKKLLQSLFILLFVASAAMAQERTITGTVTSSDDKLPIPGVSVKVKGTQAGTITDANGKYSIKIATGTTTLEFSYIGYIAETKAVGTSNSINVVLVSDSKVLSDVVVTANSISRDKRSLGYSAPTLNNTELTSGGSPSAISSLAGKVAGVNVTSTSNTPGSSARVVLRGGSSISGSNQALIVVDGGSYR